MLYLDILKRDTIEMAVCGFKKQSATPVYSLVRV